MSFIDNINFRLNSDDTLTNNDFIKAPSFFIDRTEYSSLLKIRDRIDGYIVCRLKFKKGFITSKLQLQYSLDNPYNVDDFILESYKLVKNHMKHEMLKHDNKMYNKLQKISEAIEIDPTNIELIKKFENTVKQISINYESIIMSVDKQQMILLNSNKYVEQSKPIRIEPIENEYKISRALLKNKIFAELDKIILPFGMHQKEHFADLVKQPFNFLELRSTRIAGQLFTGEAGTDFIALFLKDSKIDVINIEELVQSNINKRKEKTTYLKALKIQLNDSNNILEKNIINLKNKFEETERKYKYSNKKILNVSYKYTYNKIKKYRELINNNKNKLKYIDAKLSIVIDQKYIQKFLKLYLGLTGKKLYNDIITLKKDITNFEEFYLDILFYTLTILQIIEKNNTFTTPVLFFQANQPGMYDDDRIKLIRMITGHLLVHSIYENIL